MAEDYKRSADAHNVIIEGRRKASISGVSEVINFDENEISMNTVCGILMIEGNNLHVEKLSLDTGELVLCGIIDSVEYAEEKASKGGFWSKLF